MSRNKKRYSTHQPEQSDRFINLWRSDLTFLPFQKDPILFYAFVSAVEAAQYKPGIAEIKIGTGTKYIHLERGQFLYGRNAFSKKINQTPDVTRRKMEKLEKLQKLTIRTKDNYSIITIRNYDKYQFPQKEKTSETDQASTKQEEQTDHNQKDVIKKEKENIDVDLSIDDTLILSSLKDKNLKDRPDCTDDYVQESSTLKETSDPIQEIIDHYMKTCEEILGSFRPVKFYEKRNIKRALNEYELNTEQAKNFIEFVIDKYFPWILEERQVVGSLSGCFKPLYFQTYQVKWQSKKRDYGNREMPVTTTRWWRID